MILSLLIFIVLSFSAAVVGSISTYRSLKTWYPSLKKPSWNPPNYVFGPVWTVLYLMMAIAASMVWQRTAPHGGLPIFLFLVQLILNAAWSLVFFGLRNPAWAFFELVILWVSILLTTISFWEVYSVAGLLFLPTLLWVSFAAALNFSLWRLNQAGNSF